MASRTQKSMLNTAVSFASQFIIILLGFISRRVLIYSVGVEYLGINGLMTNILTIFSLAESGIGLAIGYALYKPLAENDIEKIKSLMRFFRTTYHALAVMTAVIGLALLPFSSLFSEGEYCSGRQYHLLYVSGQLRGIIFMGVQNNPEQL